MAKEEEMQVEYLQKEAKYVSELQKLRAELTSHAN